MEIEAQQLILKKLFCDPIICITAEVVNFKLNCGDYMSHS